MYAIKLTTFVIKIHVVYSIFDQFSSLNAQMKPYCLLFLLVPPKSFICTNSHGKVVLFAIIAKCKVCDQVQTKEPLFLKNVQFGDHFATC